MFYDEFKNNGHFILRNNFFNINDNHISEFHRIFNDPNQKKHTNHTQEILENIVIIDDINEHPHLKEFYQNLLNFFKNNNFGTLKLKDIWLQKSNETTYRENELPFIPHIDKNRSFKVMTYLNDVMKKDGPLHLIKINPERFENLRLNLSKDYFLNKENYINDLNLNNFIDCSGQIGTSIFFDTNCPHFAGKFETNSIERLIYRVNFYYN